MELLFILVVALISEFLVTRWTQSVADHKRLQSLAYTLASATLVGLMWLGIIEQKETGVIAYILGTGAGNVLAMWKSY